MNIYMSHYGKSRYLSAERYHKVSINLHKPKGLKIAHEPRLAPSRALLEDWLNGMTAEQYVTRYKAEMSLHADLRAIFVDIAKGAGGKDIVLLCYEQPGQMCHRYILANIIYDRYGYEIKEI